MNRAGLLRRKWLCPFPNPRGPRAVVQQEKQNSAIKAQRPREGPSVPFCFSASPPMKDRPRPAPGRDATVPRPRVGERFNPCHETCGFYPPDIVGRQMRESGLGDAHKRLYERSVRWAGRNGRFWHGFERIGKDLGKSSRQVKRDMDDLEKLGLIEHDRRGNRQSNMYYFLFHPMFESELTSVSSHPRGEVTSVSSHPRGEVTNPPSEVTSVSLAEVTSVSLESCKKNYVRESSSERAESSASAKVIVSRRRDDDPLSHEIENPTPEAMLELITPGLEFGDPDPLMGELPLPRPFVKAVAHAIHFSKCSTGISDVNLKLYPPPDPTIIAKILEHWRGKGRLALMDWLWSTVERQLGKKGRARGAFVYGLLSTDSEICARAWGSDRLLSRKIFEQLNLQQRRDAERIENDRVRQVMDVPVPLADAIALLDREVREWRAAVSPRFLWLMDRKASQVSPGDLLDAAINWRSCGRCSETGIIGSAMEGRPNYCECEIGRQERLDRGDDYIADEIARVRATAEGARKKP